MFGRRKQTSTRIDTLIGAGTRIIGDVQFSGGFHVDGHVKGNVDAPADSGATLSVSDPSTSGLTPTPCCLMASAASTVMRSSFSSRFSMPRSK